MGKECENHIRFDLCSIDGNMYISYKKKKKKKGEGGGKRERKKKKKRGGGGGGRKKEEKKKKKKKIKSRFMESVGGGAWCACAHALNRKRRACFERGLWLHCALLPAGNQGRINYTSCDEACT